MGLVPFGELLVVVIDLLWGFGDGGRGFVAIVKEGVEFEIFFLGDGVVFMGMAACALECEAEPDGAGGFGAVEDGFGSELFFVSAAFGVGECLSVE